MTCRRPRVVSTLLTKLDSEAAAAGFHALYGLHKIDDDPEPPVREHFCVRTKCTANASCGGPGKLCVTMGSLGKRCTAACAADGGCPNGHTCKTVASSSSSTIYGKACARLPAGVHDSAPVLLR